MISRILVRYGELALKGRNRRYFEQLLQRNIKAAVNEYTDDVTKLHGRFIVAGPEEKHEQMLDCLSRVFGIVSLSTVCETGLNLDEIMGSAAETVASVPPAKNTFRVDARRSNKDFPYTSPEISRLVGAFLLQRFPNLNVDLHQPSFKIAVEIGFKNAFLYLNRVAGPGGLPLGSSGRSLLLLSGGIDSPVAGWLAMKRGLFIEALHFHSFPFTSQRSREKVIDLGRKLVLFGGKMPLHLINVASIQKELRSKCPEDLSIILLRRMMFRLAEMLSDKRGLHAIVTGENLGQVASQTLESLHVIEEATDMLVLRPLVGMDKLDIISIARKINTYDVSIRPYDDCCTLFVPENPVTKPKLAAIIVAEANLDIGALLEEAMETAELIVINRSFGRLPASE
ncbi:MAG TPA: tRNA uracil 4-sulfurtransferase ThiI [Candidatus Limnocylindrales bacterium]|nr:tRNA uracil 4-sulfurtransferase ThiI [Candidatus Limnocylindrales bacterium]